MRRAVPAAAHTRMAARIPSPNADDCRSPNRRPVEAAAARAAAASACLLLRGSVRHRCREWQASEWGDRPQRRARL